MVELKSRPAYILKRAAENKDGIQINDFLGKLNITKRTLYYDLENINEWMKSYDFGYAVIEGQKIVIHTSKWNNVQKRLADINGYFFSIEERREMELLYITLSHEIVTIEKMQKYFSVSKNTILSDIKELKLNLASIGVTVMSAIKTGYYLKGEEFAIRKIIGQTIYHLSNPGPKEAIKEMLQNSLNYYMNMDIDFFELGRCIIKQYEKDIKGELVPSYVDYECIMIMVSWARSKKGFEFHMSSDEKITLMNTVSYHSIQLSILKLEKNDIYIPPVEIYYITTLFLGIKTADFKSQEQENQFIAQFVKELVKNFERVSCISITDKDILYEKLSYHIRPLYYRLKYGVTEGNLLLDDIKEMYPVYFDFTCRAVKEMDDDIGDAMSEDELAYLCIYFVSHLNEKKGFSDSKNQKEKILIICAAGMATSVLVKEQIEALLGDIFHYEMISVKKIKDVRLEQYILIISTANLEALNKRHNVIYTGPIITDEVRNKIIYMIEKNGLIPKYDKGIQDIITAAEDNCSGQINKSKLYFDIFRLLCKRGDVTPNRIQIQNFQEKIDRGNIIYLKENACLADVIRSGCNDLMKEKPSVRLYGRMMNLFKRNRQKVYQIRPEVLLIHCPMQGGDDGRVDISIVVTEESIKLKNGMDGRIFILLSTIDSGSHSYLLVSVYKYFDEPGSIYNLIKTEELTGGK